MSGNDDGDNNDQYETSNGQSPALMRSNKDQGAIGSGSSTKKGAFDDQKHGRSKKKGHESTPRKVVIIHQPHLLLLQKVIPLKEKRKRLVKTAENIATKKVHLLQMNQILKKIFTPKPFKVISEADKYNIICPL